MSDSLSKAIAMTNQSLSKNKYLLLLFGIFRSLLHFLIYRQHFIKVIILPIYFHILCPLSSAPDPQNKSPDDFCDENTDNTDSDTRCGSNENWHHNTDDEAHESMARTMVESMTVVFAGTTMFLTLSMTCGTTSATVTAERFEPVGKSTFPI